MRFDIYAIGQYRENYGAHDWDGTGECPQYWKNKGSTTKLIFENVSLEQLEAYREQALEQINSGDLFERNDSFSASYNDIILFPAGCHPDVSFAVEHELKVSDMRQYSYRKDLTEEHIQQYRDWCRFFGQNHLVDA